MPLYHYSAIDKTGKKRSGYIEASVLSEAKEILRNQGFMVSSLSLKTKSTSSDGLKGENLMTFTIQLSQLVSAGIPLYESLVAIEEQYRGESFHRILLSLCEQIKAGTPLSTAMSQYPDSFDTLYTSMVRAGESVGVLNIVLEKLSVLLDRQAKLKKQIVTALIYPGILAVFSLLIIGMLLGFVVPSIEGIFEDRKLNGFTEFVLSVSRIARNYWWLYLPLLAGLIGFLVYWMRSKEGKIKFQRFAMRLPLVGKVMVQAAVARFCRTMGTLQLGGLPMIESLDISRSVMNNVVLEEEVKRAEMKIIEGSSLGKELSRSKLIPPMVSRMLLVGEEAGGLVPMLNKIAEMYEQELEKNLERLMALAQPLILIFMGVVIGVILMAILLPLTDISSLTGE